MASKVTAKRLVTIAVGQKGVKESPSGSNRQKYGAWYGMNGVAWCAEFVSWAYAQAGDISLIHGKYARTDAKAKALNTSKLLHKGASGMKYGDVAFFAFHGSRFEGRYLGIHHTGICIGRLADGRYIMIEGNTSQSSNDNGGEVQVRYRSPSSIAAYFRPKYAAAAKPKPKSAAAKRVTVTATALNIRVHAGTQYKVVETVKKGASLGLLGLTSKDGLWIKVVHGKHSGWVAKRFTK